MLIVNVIEFLHFIVLHIPMEYECETKQNCFYKN